LSLLRKLYHAVAIALAFAYSMAEVAVQRPRTRAARAAWLSRLCSRLMRSMNMTVSTIGPVPMHGAVISNHLSYTDVLLHSASRPCVFVAKAELRKTPILGWCSMMSGTVYVSRGAGGSAARAGEEMAAGFRDGLPVVFFPEGTTGVGDEPTLPFRSGLLSQTLAAGAPITAAFVRYQLSARDLAHGKTVRRDVVWGPETLLQNMWKLFGTRSMTGTIEYAAQPIAFSNAALTDRKLAAIEARDAVAALGKALGK
jgi:1-acyl-sn-glycerol-3-phosphate acyltransferase